MPIREERPYVQFNFRVSMDLLGLDPKGFSGGFQEISGLGMEVTVSEYRNGNDRNNGTRKITGLNKQSDVTLKRGVIGAIALYTWLDDIRNGNQQAFRDVTIELLSESREPVLEWRLLRARAIKVSYGPLNAKGNDVTMEELVLSYERLELVER